MSIQEFKKHHDTIGDNILKLVKEHPTISKDYRKLVYYYWYYIEGLVDFIPMQNLLGLSNPDSIGRAFRKLVEDKKLEVDKKTKQIRLRQEELYRGYYR